jgi:hypothetical protein
MRTHRSFTPTALALACTAALGAASGPATAATLHPTHVTRSVGPLVADLPAGAVCDFAYHQQVSYTQNLTRFTDASGTLVRVEDEVDLTVLHRNVETGRVLTEEDHYAAFVDLVDGTVRETGTTWELRDESGRLVRHGAGLVEYDLVKDAMVGDTPGADADFATTICPALGGAPA